MFNKPPYRRGAGINTFQVAGMNNMPSNTLGLLDITQPDIFFDAGDDNPGGPPAVVPPVTPAVTPPAEDDWMAGLDAPTRALMQQKITAAASVARGEGKKAGKDEAAAEATRKKATEQGQYQTLYETEQTQHNDLKKKVTDEYEPALTTLKELTEAKHAEIDVEVKAWDDDLKKQDPGPSADIRARMKWVNDNRAMAKRLGLRQQAPSTEPGLPGATTGSSSSKSAGNKTAADNYLESQQYAIPGQ